MAENRQQALYWAALVQLKVDCAYIRLYRDNLATTQTRFAVIRAVVSVSALGTWAAIKSYPMVWGGIIAAAQVADALQNALQYGARLRGATALSFTLDALFIDCQMEWEDIFGGRVEEAEISKRRHKLMIFRLDADKKNLPHRCRCVPRCCVWRKPRRLPISRTRLSSEAIRYAPDNRDQPAPYVAFHPHAARRQAAAGTERQRAEIGRAADPVDMCRRGSLCPGPVKAQAYQ